MILSSALNLVQRFSQFHPVFLVFFKSKLQVGENYMPGNAPVPGFVELGTIILALPFWKKCMPTGNVIAI